MQVFYWAVLAISVLALAGLLYSFNKELKKKAEASERERDYNRYSGSSTASQDQQKPQSTTQKETSNVKKETVEIKTPSNSEIVLPKVELPSPAPTTPSSVSSQASPENMPKESHEIQKEEKKDSNTSSSPSSFGTEVDFPTSSNP